MDSSFGSRCFAAVVASVALVNANVLPPLGQSQAFGGLVKAAPVGLHELLKRQASSEAITLTVTIAPDRTCGYLSGVMGNPMTCRPGSTCLWESNVIDIIICAKDDEHEEFTRCYDRVDALNPNACDNVCEGNLNFLKCTDTAVPFCRTYAYPGGIRDYKCGPTPISSIQSVSFTYIGQQGRPFVTTVITSGVYTARTSSSQPFPDPTTPKSPHISASEPPGPATNVGAIVGGTVGGAFVLGMVVLGVLFLLRKKSPPPPQPGELSTDWKKSPPPPQPEELPTDWNDHGITPQPVRV